MSKENDDDSVDIIEDNYTEDVKMLSKRHHR